MKKILIIQLFLGTLLAAGCKKEATPPASALVNDPFARTDDPANAITHNIYTVYQATHVPILYTDTLQANPLQLLDLNYHLTGTDGLMEIRYLHDAADIQAGIDFVNTSVIPSLNGSLKPHAVMLLDSIITDDFTWPDGSRHYITASSYQGLSALVIGDIAKIKTMDAAAMATYKTTIFSALLSIALNNNPVILQGFYGVSNSFYYSYVDPWHGYSVPFPPKEQFGILSDGTENPTYGYYIRDKSYDLSLFMKAFLSMPEADFLQQYSAYPLVITKYNLLKQALTGLGFKKI